ncbi:hypothetical protein [Rikenella microfusus]|uniref:Type III restriction-modification system StyLTI enzyme res n=1 Tax=Rikenella microfusus TaxID=28139 RepID=A0A379MRD3_9BACT|nr:hypothetical protein [Rikenella microfusus]SUE34284.1 type III restriction-modification system StyLTI enzyme res [Rikenella microfusus]
MDFDKAYKAKKHITDYVFSDSKGERQFAHDLDEAKEVVVYAKLPRTFQIPTPVGNYAPDWAIAMEVNGIKHIFFIAENLSVICLFSPLSVDWHLLIYED